MKIRKYKAKDCAALSRLFYETVHFVNCADYTKEQLDAWATGQVDLEEWNQSFLEHITLVAEEEGEVVGFADMARDGYLDRLYVHKDHQRQGIAGALCGALEQAVPREIYTAYASITAKPFFEKQGYQAVRENQVQRGGVILRNYLMRKRSPLSADPLSHQQNEQ